MYTHWCLKQIIKYSIQSFYKTMKSRTTVEGRPHLKGLKKIPNDNFPFLINPRPTKGPEVVPSPQRIVPGRPKTQTSAV